MKRRLHFSLCPGVISSPHLKQMPLTLQSAISTSVNFLEVTILAGANEPTTLDVMLGATDKARVVEHVDNLGTESVLQVAVHSHTM
jgi:hypothetical protein